MMVDWKNVVTIGNGTLVSTEKRKKTESPHLIANPIFVIKYLIRHLIIN